MAMLGYVEPELEHVKKALFFAREIDGRLLIHCRALWRRERKKGL